MAVTENDLLVGPLVLGLGVSNISVDYLVEDAEFLEVYKSGSDVPLVLNVDYTFAGEGTEDGVITLTVPGDGVASYAVYLIVPFQRTSDLQLRGEFKSEPFNTELDRVWRALQGLRTRLTRSLRVSVTSDTIGSLSTFSENERAERLLAFSPDGKNLVLGQREGSVVSAYQGRQYAGRIAFENDIAAGYAPADGTVVTAGGVQYERKAGADVLPGLPGWRLFGVDDVEGDPFVNSGPQNLTAPQQARARSNINSTTVVDTRKTLSFVVHADGQPRINDEEMPAGQENVQWGIYLRVLDEMGRSFGNKVAGMLHAGDMTWLGNMSSTALSGVRAAKAAMDPSDPGYDLLADADSLTVGDEYPWGHAAVLDAIERNAKISRSRVFVAAGNHDRSGAGNGTNPVAHSFDAFEKYFGKTSSFVIEGNVGFYFLGDDSTTTGGQITRRSVDQARRVIKAHKQVKHWAFVIHQPPAGRNPNEAASPTEKWSDPVTLTSGQVSSWEGGGEPLVNVGDYAGLRTNRTNIYLVHPHFGRFPLKHGRDYLFSTNPATPGPYAEIQILQTWAHGPLTTSTTLQLNEVFGLGGVQDGPTTYLLETLFADVKPWAVFHGHTGELWNTNFNNIRQVPEWGDAWLVNMNMGLPTRAREGIDPITAPLISALLEFDAEADTARFRYWNHTATIDGVTGEYTGDFLNATHPTAPYEFIVSFADRGGLDLGVEGSTTDGRRGTGREAELKYLAMERDIREAPSRSEPLRNADGSLITTTDLEGNPIPTYSTTAAGRVKFGDFAVTDRSQKDINAGDGGYFGFGVPVGLDSTAGGESNWRDDQPSVEAARMYWETTSGSDTTPVGAVGFEVLDAAGVWQDVLRMTASGLFTLGNPIIESGTNANGTFIKYADGTLVCTGEVDITNLPTGASAAITTVTLPASRISFGFAPTAQVTINASASKWSAGADRGKYMFSSRSDAVGTLTILYYAIAGTSPSGPNGSVGYTLTTRWK